MESRRIWNSTTAEIKVKGRERQATTAFRANGSVIKFDGFLKVYAEKASTTNSATSKKAKTTLKVMTRIAAACRRSKPSATRLKA
jgi:DNA topoisomerase IA